MWILFYGLIISSSFLVIPSTFDPFWRTKEIAYILFCFLIIGSSWLYNHRFKREFTCPFYAAFFIYISLLFFYHFFFPMMAAPSQRAVWYVYTLLPSLNCLLGLLTIKSLVDSTDTVFRWVTAIKIVCAAGTCIAVYAICQYFGCDQLFPHLATRESLDVNSGARIYRMFTFLGNKMATNNFIALVCPLFFVFNRKRYYLGFGVCLIALLLFRSAFNLFSAVAGVMFILVCRRRWWPVGVTVFFSVMYITVFGKFTNIDGLAATGFNGRWDYWVEVLSKVKNRIFTGYGLGAIARTYANHLVTFKRWTSSHNFMFDMIYETGVIGAGIIAAYFINLTRRIIDVFRRSEQQMFFIGLIGCGITWLLISNSSFLHMIPSTAVLGILVIGGIESHINKRRMVGV